MLRKEFDKNSLKDPLSRQGQCQASRRLCAGFISNFPYINFLKNTHGLHLGR